MSNFIILCLIFLNPYEPLIFFRASVVEILTVVLPTHAAPDLVFVVKTLAIALQTEVAFYQE